jgi:hypothetical protein
MSIRDRARADIKRIAEKEEPIKFTSPLDVVCNVVGLHTRHHLNVDFEGQSTNSTKAHVMISEESFKDASYTVRNAQGEVDLSGHKVDAKDSNGVLRSYIVKEWYQNETFNAIVIILDDYINE